MDGLYCPYATVNGCMSYRNTEDGEKRMNYDGVGEWFIWYHAPGGQAYYTISAAELPCETDLTGEWAVINGPQPAPTVSTEQCP